MAETLIERIAAGRKRFLYPSDRDFDIVGNMVVEVPLAMCDLLLEAADEITALRQPQIREVERVSTSDFDIRDRKDPRAFTVYAPLDRIRFMARANGYVMCRKPGAAPFVLTEREWSKLPIYGATPESNSQSNGGKS